MIKDEILNELQLIRDLLQGIEYLSKNDVVIQSLSLTAQHRISELTMKLVGRDMLIECCKQHWLHGGKCE